MYRLLITVMVAGAVVGCTTTQSVPVTERSRTYDASAQVVFEAVLDALTAQGYPIDFVDRENGLVVTGFRYERTFLDERRVRANVYVDDGPGGRQTRLTLLLSAEDVDKHGHVGAEMVLDRTARAMYQDLLDEIEMRL